MKVNYPTEGIEINHICEFFSQTENGMLYFESYTSDMENNVLTVANPIKHRFLQRRKFTRITFLQTTKLYRDDISYEIQTLDLSAGGMKFKSKNHINIDTEYNVDIVLSAKNPRDLEVLMKFRHKIEEQIVDYLNTKSYKEDKKIRN